jgi:hypothetical protein
MVLALRAGEKLRRALDDQHIAEACSQASARLARHCPPHGQIKQAAALLALAGLIEPSKANAEVLGVEPLRGVSTFYGYFVLQARAAAGDIAGCLELIRRYWGTMLDFGATTFWEDFDLDWTLDAAGIDQLVPNGKKDIHGDFGNYCYKGFRHSLCHGWAAGPTAWLSEHVLGVTPLEPGCRLVKLAPKLGDLEWAMGAFPTPFGPITLEHARLPSGKIGTKVRAPTEIKIEQGKEPLRR